MRGYTITLAIIIILSHGVIRAQDLRPTPNEEITTPSIQSDIPAASLATPALTVATPPEIPPTASLTRQSTDNRSTSPNIATTITENIAEKITIVPPEEVFMFPPEPINRYPDIEVAGFHESKFSFRDYSPKLNQISATDNRWEIIQRDPIFTKLPRDVLVGDPKFDIRYRFQIDGKLDDDLSVHYDIEQEPDFPGKYDIVVKYKTTELTFYHFDAIFKNGEFINTQKALDGAKVESYTDDWETIVAMGRQRSKPQKFTSPGNNGKTFKVGRQFLLQNSVQVWVNNSPLNEGVDYDVNYFEGSVTFKRTIGATEIVEVIYEYTNPIEDFIPILNRKNFFGAQFIWEPKQRVRTERVTRQASETFKSDKTQSVSGNREFKLKHGLLTLGEDTVKLNDLPLRRNKDYFLRHQKGTLILRNKSLTDTDVLSISYVHYGAKPVSETLVGNNSPGPYILANKHILDESATVFVDGEEKQEPLDYILDNESGKLFFNYQIRYPQLVAISYRAIETITVTPDAKESPLKVGISYMNEYVQSRPEELEIKVTSESFTTTSNTFFTAQNPLINTANLEIALNGEILSTDNYEIISAYRGEIRIINKSPGSGQISYTFRKSSKITDQFSGKGPGVREYQGTDLIELNSLPIKYKGVNRIQIGTTPLQEGVDYTIDYGEDGQTGPNGIKITFNKESDVSNAPSNPQLKDYPGTNQPITIVYQHTPQNAPDQGNVSQTMIGLNARSKVNDHWSIDSEIVAAGHNFSRERTDGKTTFQGNGIENHVYKLDHNNLVENSDTVYVKNVNKTEGLIKDKEYFINYVNGTIRFPDLSKIGKGNQITVEYDYFVPNSKTVAGEQQNLKYATKFGTKYQDDRFTFNADYKFIDRNFKPIGNIQEAKGTTSFGGNMALKFNEANLDDNIWVEYRRRDIFAGKPDEEKFRHTDDIKARLNYKWFDYIDSEQEIRGSFDIQDPDAGTSNHSIDDATVGYKGTVHLGPDNFRTKIIRDFSRTFTDFLDRKAPANTISETSSIKSDIKWEDLYLLGDVTFAPEAETVQTRTKATQISSTGNISEDQSYSVRDKLSLKSSYQPLKSLRAILDYDITNIRSKTPEQTEEDGNMILNRTYEFTYRPFSWFISDYRNQHSESESPIINRKGETTDYQAYNIGKLKPYDALTWAGADPNAWYTKPLANSFGSFGTSESRNSKDDNNNVNSNQNRNISYSNFSPIQGIKINNIRYEFFDANSALTRGSDTTSASFTTTRREKRLGQFSVKLPYWGLDLFDYQYNFDERLIDNSQTRREATFATSNHTVDNKPHFSRTQTLTYNPGSIKVPILNWFALDLGNFNAGITETFRDEINSKTTDTFIPSNNTKNLVSTTTKQDTIKEGKRTYSAGANPLRLFSVNGTFSDGESEYRRNLSQANLGFTYNENRHWMFNGTYTPFSFLSFSGNYENRNDTEHKSSSLNLTVDEIKRVRENNRSIFENFIDKNETIRSLSATFTPFSFISFTGGGKIKDIRQETESKTASYNKETINQREGSLGTILRPFSGLSISYKYSLKFTREEKENSVDNKGFEGNLNIAYSPFQTNDFKVNITYSRVDTWGRDLNTLDVKETKQGTGDTIQTTIVDRQDTVEIGSLSIDINIPLKDSPYVEAFVVTGEGHVKKVTDALDASKAQPRSYDIGGVSIKGTLHF